MPAGRPVVLILLGRAVSQGGFFVFLVAPAVKLGDSHYNALITTVTLGLLFVTAPMGAFQQHLVRLPAVIERPGLALLRSAQLGAVGLAAAWLISLWFIPAAWWVGAVLVGNLVAGLVAWSATLLAVHHRFRKSAFVDGFSGLTLLGAALVAWATNSGVVIWAVGFGLAWAGAAIVAGVALRVAPSTTVAEPPPTRALYGQSARLLLIGIAAMAFNRSDYLVLTLVGDPSEASRYALASRFIGPALIALGSLNNSLYPRQVQMRDDLPALRRLSNRVGVRAVALAVAVGVASIVGVMILDHVSTEIASRDLLVPTIILAASVVPYALVVPLSFAFTAIHQEHVWLGILIAATVGDALMVWAFGDRGATTVATIWLITQVAVAATVLVAFRITESRRTTAVPSA